MKHRAEEGAEEGAEVGAEVVPVCTKRMQFDAETCSVQKRTVQRWFLFAQNGCNLFPKCVLCKRKCAEVVFGYC